MARIVRVVLVLSQTIICIAQEDTGHALVGESCQSVPSRRVFAREAGIANTGLAGVNSSAQMDVKW